MPILIVEDNSDVAAALEALPNIEGHDDVTIVHHGTAALAHVRRSPPDLVLCDIGLPGIGGLEFARTCRRDPQLRDLNVVAISGYGGGENRARAIEAGFDDLLAKPIQFESLSDCVRRLCSGQAKGRAADVSDDPC